jgi:hypothetical protein
MKGIDAAVGTNAKGKGSNGQLRMNLRKCLLLGRWQKKRNSEESRREANNCIGNKNILDLEDNYERL